MTPEQQKALALARARRLRKEAETGPAVRQDAQAEVLDNYYSSGLYGGEYNPLGAVARSLDAASTGARDALTFGFGDEIYGALTPGSIDEERARSAALQESNPVASVVGTVGGGLTLGAGGLARNATGAVTGSAGLMSALPSANIASSAPLAAKMLAGGAEGAAMGAAYGVGSGENTWDRVGGGVMGGLTGGALGAAVPAVVQGVSSGYRNVTDYLSRNQVARDASVSPEVARLLTRVTDADGTLGPTGAANMARAGQEAMVADAGGNAQQLLDAATQRGGPGASMARSRIDDRLTRDSGALVSTLDNTLGTPEGLYSSQANIREGARDSVSQAYRAANAAPIDYASEAGQRVESAINRIPSRIKSQAIAKANERMVWDQMPNQQIMADIAEDGTVNLREMPNVMQADYIKKALDDLVTEGTDIGGKMNGDAQFANAMRRELRDSLASASDEYATALRTAADPLSRQEAVRTGYDLLTDRLKRDQAAMAFEGMTDPQRAAARQGVRSYIDDTMAKVQSAFTDPNMDAREAAKAIKGLSSRANREKMALLLGDQEATQLFDEIDRASQSFALKASQAQNSKTFAREATNNVANELIAPGPLGTLAEGEPLNAAKRIVQTLTGRTPENLSARKDAFFSEIADYLTRPSDQALPSFQAMQNFQGQTAQNAQRSAEIARLLSAGQSAVYPATVVERR